MKKAVSLLLIVVVIISTFISCVDNEKNNLSEEIVATSDNFKVTYPMMQYFTNSYIQNWYSQNYYYILLGYITFDMYQPFNEQYTDSSNTQTYYDFFLQGTKTTVTTYLSYCEAAKADTLTSFEELQADAEKYADDLIAKLKEAWDEENVQYEIKITFANYIRQHFGDSVTEDALKQALIIEHISSSYYSIIHQRIFDCVNSDEEYEYLKNNLSQFITAEYLVYTVSSMNPVDMPNSEDYIGGVNSFAYLEAIAGLTADKIAELNIDPVDYEGGTDSVAYQKDLKTAMDNKAANEDSFARDKAAMDRLAAATSEAEFMRIILEEKYESVFSSTYNTETKNFASYEKPTEDILNEYKTNELKNAVINAVLNDEDSIDRSIINIDVSASSKWQNLARNLPDSLIINLKKEIAYARKTTSYTLSSVLGNKLFGGVKADYGINYESFEVEGTNAPVNSCWQWNMLEINLENAELSYDVTEDMIYDLTQRIAKETDANKKKDLEDEKQVLEERLYSYQHQIEKARKELESSSTTSEYSCSAYFVTKAAHNSCDYKTRDVGHIMFKVDTSKYTDPAVSYNTSAEAKAAAEKLFAEIKAENNLTKEKFEEFGSVTHDTAVFYYDVEKGMMVNEFDNWLYAAETSGELGLVETPYGCHIMYYAGEAEELLWRKIAKESVANEDVDAWYNGLPYTVSVDDSYFEQIFKNVVLLPYTAY